MVKNISQQKDICYDIVIYYNHYIDKFRYNLHIYYNKHYGYHNVQNNQRLCLVDHLLYTKYIAENYLQYEVIFYADYENGVENLIRFHQMD
jgi:hypothetical protein